MKDLKLNAINRKRLAEKQMNSIKGGASEKPSGASCGCACASANQGGASTNENAMANAAKGLTSSGNVIIWVTYVNEEYYKPFKP